MRNTHAALANSKQSKRSGSILCMKRCFAAMSCVVQLTSLESSKSLEHLKLTPHITSRTPTHRQMGRRCRAVWSHLHLLRTDTHTRRKENVSVQSQVQARYTPTHSRRKRQTPQLKPCTNLIQLHRFFFSRIMLSNVFKPRRGVGMGMRFTDQTNIYFFPLARCCCLLP